MNCSNGEVSKKYKPLKPYDMPLVIFKHVGITNSNCLRLQSEFIFVNEKSICVREVSSSRPERHVNSVSN